MLRQLLQEKDQHPIKQGLRPVTPSFSSCLRARERPTSNKTRIKTVNPLILPGLSAFVRKTNIQ